MVVVQGTPDSTKNYFTSRIPTHAVATHAGDVAVLQAVLIKANGAVEYPLKRLFWLPQH